MKKPRPVWGHGQGSWKSRSGLAVETLCTIPQVIRDWPNDVPRAFCAASIFAVALLVALVCTFEVLIAALPFTIHELAVEYCPA